MLLALSNVIYFLISWFKFLLPKFLYEYWPWCQVQVLAIPGRASSGVGIVEGRDMASPMEKIVAGGWWCNTDWNTSRNRAVPPCSRDITLLQPQQDMQQLQ